jgi:hypothetical protein
MAGNVSFRGIRMRACSRERGIDATGEPAADPFLMH